MESVSQGLSTLHSIFQFYYTISELQLRNSINSICLKLFINKKVDLWGPVAGGGKLFAAKTGHFLGTDSLSGHRKETGKKNQEARPS